MPIYEFECLDCGRVGEVLILGGEEPRCEGCGSPKLKKLMSATSPLTGSARMELPGPGDTACCGVSPAEAICEGPGSCCGKSFKD